MKVVGFNGSARKDGNIGISRNAGDVEKDEEGIGIMRDLGTNMAWLLKKISG